MSASAPQATTGPFLRLPRLVVSNVWVYDAGDEGRWLIDCGHRFERWMLLRQLARHGIEPGRLAGILLTHRHCDHAGNAAFFHQRFGLRVCCHRADAAILSGEQPRPRMPVDEERLLASMMTVFENKLPAAPVKVEPLDDGQAIAGLTLYWAPGHTEGSSLFWHAPSATLATGDTVLNAIPPLAQKPGLSLPHPTFSTSLAQALESLRAFHRRGVEYQNVLPGHGPALLGGARAQVEKLLREAEPSE